MYGIFERKGREKGREGKEGRRTAKRGAAKDGIFFSYYCNWLIFSFSFSIYFTYTM